MDGPGLDRKRILVWMKMPCVCVPARLGCESKRERGQKTGRCFRFQPKSRHLHFVCWKPSVKLWSRPICIAGWPWRGWFCSFTIEKPCPHTAGSKTCPPRHQQAPTRCPSSTSPLALLFGQDERWLFHHCVVWPGVPAGSSFINPLWGFQHSPRAPHKHTRTRTRTHT